MKVLVIHCTYKIKSGEDAVVAEEIRLLQTKGTTVQLLSFDNERNTLLNVLQLPFNIGSYLKVRRILRSFNPDVVHIHNLHFAASPSVIYAVKHVGIPVVMTLHNFRLLCPSATLFSNGSLFLDSLKQAFPWQAVRQGVYRNSRVLTFWLSFSMWIHRAIGTWKMCRRYIVLSDHSLETFLRSEIRIEKERFVIKPNFSYPVIEQSGKDNGTFLYIGRLSEEKGIKLLLETFSENGSKLKIAGTGPLLDEVKQYARKHQNIEYLGLLSKKEIHSHLSASTALIFPSIWFEGMPLSIIEAFACGVPVIASRIGVMEQMIVPGYNGLHFEAANREDFAAKLQHWIRLSSQVKSNMRKNAVRSYEQYYTPEKNYDHLISIYTSVI